MDKTGPVIILITITLLVGLVVAESRRTTETGTAVLADCIQHEAITMHLHPTLAVRFDGVPSEIPGSIGVSETCMRPIHTHTPGGTIHLEYPRLVDFTLGDFFTTWGQPFSRTQLLDRIVDTDHALTMTVDGTESTEFEHLILKDGQQIELRFETKVAAMEN